MLALSRLVERLNVYFAGRRILSHSVGVALQGKPSSNRFLICPGPEVDMAKKLLTGVVTIVDRHIHKHVRIDNVAAKVSLGFNMAASAKTKLTR
jgi:hypothetical protein